jgi:hypothetical protein
MNLGHAMADIKVGDPTVYGGLAVFPLIGRNPGKRDYLTLNEALREKGVTVSEVSEGGSVPELRLKNNLEKDVFAADGEALLGAKQNRVLNSSIYVKAGDEVIIPVSCVEQGRWSYRQRNFQASEHSEFVASRAAKMGAVASSLRRGGWDRESDQGEVWRQMEEKRTYFQAEAPTGSMADVYESARPSLDQYLNHIRTQPNQVGLACAIDGKTAGIEMFEDTSVFNQFFHKLVRAYAAEVVNDDRIATMVPDRNALRHLLNKVSRIQCEEYEAVGSGKELRFKTGRLNGSALEVDGRLLHVVLLRNSSRAMH